MEAPYNKKWFRKGIESDGNSSHFSPHEQASKQPFSQHAAARSLTKSDAANGDSTNEKSVNVDPLNRSGFVSIVGAGPHDPDLLTMKAVKAIRAADVLLYDRLVNKDILSLSSPQADWIYVGKRCGQPSIVQEEICELIVSLAKQGKRVVRLKGGDPLVFGRGGEEALALVEHKIAYEIIPGITAAIGCAASSHIPLTHRGVSRSVTLVTGQVVTGAFDAWRQLMQSGQTLVFYMGLEKSDEIERGLVDAGLSGSFPVAVITHGCSPQQQVHVSQLDQLSHLSRTLKGVSPALIVMGEVVKLREQLLATVSSEMEWVGS